jgi:hypothetical protein
MNGVKNQINKWILLYKASRDGFKASKFHDKCNNKGPTVSIIRSTDGYIFGGYTSKSWNSYSRTIAEFVKDANSFIFTLTNPNGIPPTMYSNITPKDSIYDWYLCVPTFGVYDVNVFDESNANQKSYTNFPRSYQDTTGYGKNTFTGTMFFQTNEIEVITTNEFIVHLKDSWRNYY